MDLAYDQIAADALPKDRDESAPSDSSKTAEQQQPTLNEDLQEAYKAISTSAWGSKLGGFFGNVVKQGESVYREASQELTSLGADAARGAADLRSSLISRTRSLSLATSPQAASSADKDREADATPTDAKDMTSEEAIKESETVISRLRAEAAKRLKDIQKAEDAADEALLKFGANIRDFLTEAVKIAPPAAGADGQGSTVLFESKDASGKRVIHTSRYDAQLHVIHTSVDSFAKDPAGDEFAVWAKDFNVESKTEDISSDLAKYPELRTTMEKLVPDQVPYADFWKRYYFLRHSVEAAEERRRELLKAAEAEEEVGWDEDSDDEAAAAAAAAKPARPASTESSTTIHPPKGTATTHLRPAEPRKSNDEKSQADSDTSYDVVGAASGVPSQAPNSPKEARKEDDSDEEDWE
ncbi:hypothetical protein JX265_000963 [Neoarthrinium moseri]|uniref:BSD domain-containing protein n=1 Tax=Neoarthrinium moseri TaxID=1658444 RepID=A0A9P9WWT1_9PEZI|nr:uncharacterized protein JN550_004764 [Neoarthrinium moseri]KAI1846039.1 hypothetical protein JX266_007848 [Neoarthrinium moseri]KAI1871319.1 hypothetical protein JN550_004764 [Neoarthrinium moseri]KAI1880723.1 hypothetical protein JX265_000963 [Neoarthrinium moseri]